MDHTPQPHSTPVDAANSDNSSHDRASATKPGVRLAQKLGLNTLLGRYLLASAVLVAVILGAAWFAHQKVKHVTETNTLNQSDHDRIRNHLTEISNEVWAAETAMQHYLIAPEAGSRAKVLGMLDHLIEDGRKFSGYNWTRNNPAALQHAQKLAVTSVQLRAGVEHLLELRVDPDKIFPAVDIMRNELHPATIEIITQTTLAMEESETAAHSTAQDEVHQHFADSRYAWSLVNANFRLYVANRFGILSNAPATDMAKQRNDILQYLERIEANLVKLAELDKRGALEFQQQESLGRLRPLVKQWRDGFRKATAIFESDRWRLDVPLMRDTIYPLFSRCWENLIALQKELDVRQDEDIQDTTEMAGMLANSLWLLALFSVLLVAAGVLAFEWHIRRPIARVASALKAEAEGATDIALPATSTVETRNLVSAFDNMREQVHSREQNIRAILDNAAEGIITFDQWGMIESFNGAAERLFGWSAAEIAGTSIAQLIAPESREKRDGYLEHFLRQEIKRLVGLEGEALGRHKDGTIFPVSIKVTGMELSGQQKYIALLANIAERKAMLERLRQLAEHDGLTGLYNRSYFLTELERLVDHMRRNEHLSGALLYLDLDHFKYTNDTLGHAAGDQLLVEAANILSRRARKSDLVVRLGGDEFVVLMYDTERHTVEQMAESFRQQLAGFVFHYQGRSVDIGCSIGVAILDTHIPSSAEALMQADLACHLAKRGGRNRVHVFATDDAKDIATMSLDMGWSRRIREALEQDRFELVVQPIARTSGGAVECHEILLRMLDEDGSFIMPSGFLPTAERFGLAAEIDQWVIRHAIDTLVLQRAAEPTLRYSINLSAQSITLPAVADLIAHKIEETGLDPSALTFEVTETAAISDMSTAVTFFARLRALGCKTALDDFGSGMSSFAYLSELPVDLVKIDGRFVKNLEHNLVDRAMVKAMNDIAHALGKETLGEFVENEEILQQLGELGVDYGQGYHVGRPRSVDAPAAAKKTSVQN